jgi:SAM-dependent methyltransferase
MAMLTSHLTDALLSVSASRVFRRPVVLPPGTVKVNIGSGLAVAPGWINLDASLNALVAHLPQVAQRVAYRGSGSRLQVTAERYRAILQANRFVFCDVRRGLPLPDDSVDYLYASHILEHLERDEAMALIIDARRVLKPGGVLRIVVPDFAHFVRLYEMGHREEAVAGIFSAGVSGRLGRHRYMYDEDGLRQLVSKAGFSGFECCGFRQGSVPDIELLDNRQDESLYAEVTERQSPT